MKLEKRKAFLINFAYFSVLVLAAVALLSYVLPMLAPFVAALIIAALLKRPIHLLNKYLRLPWRLSALLVTLLFFAVLGLVISLLGIRLVSVSAALAGELPHLYDVHVKPFFMSILLHLEDVFLRMDISLLSIVNQLGGEFIQTLGKMVSNLSVSAMSFASSFATSLPALFIELVLLIISTLFITMDYERLTDFCIRQLSDNSRTVFLQIKKYVLGTLLVCIRSYMLIMFITFVELCIGLTLLGLQHGILIAFLISLFDILPVLGTGGIMIPWIIIAALQGKYSLALGLLLVYLVITVIRNIIEPKIVGSQLGLHPVVILVSMFAGAQLFGVLGLFGFPIGLSLLCYLNANGVITLFK